MVDALRETDLSISPDSSLPRKTPMQTHENGISISLSCLSSDSEGMVLDSLAHEISHVLMNKKDETFKIKYNPLDELYRNNLDEAKSVSLALQIGAELDELGINRITSYNVCYTKLLRMLTEKLPNGKTSADIIDNSLELLKGWKKGTRDCVIHLEVASTQDKVVRKQIIEKIAPEMDSIGLNERETIDVLEVINKA